MTPLPEQAEQRSAEISDPIDYVQAWDAQEQR